jgi:hypothetical protein
MNVQFSRQPTTQQQYHVISGWQKPLADADQKTTD